MSETHEEVAIEEVEEEVQMSVLDALKEVSCGIDERGHFLFCKITSLVLGNLF
jgi:hypothetical protein